MGGGGAMRAATKVATAYGLNTGLRGATSSIPLQENSVPTVGRASKPVAAIVTSSSAADDVKTSVLVSSKHGNSDDSGLLPKASWETDDWEFAGDEEEFLLDSVNPVPRIVFGGVPTLEEAQEATSDLKEALEREYFLNVDCNKSFLVRESTLSRSGQSKTKACITSESAVAHSTVPKPVFHAFALLKESSEAQGVVASLASDKNVWDAVMQNEKVMEFINKQQNSAPSDTDSDIKEASEDEFYNNPKSSGNGLMKFLEKVKIKMTDFLSDLPGFFQSMFGGPVEDNISMDANGNATMKTSIGASFMGLAVLAIMVVVLKRG